MGCFDDTTVDDWLDAAETSINQYNDHGTSWNLAATHKNQRTFSSFQMFLKPSVRKTNLSFLTQREQNPWHSIILGCPAGS